MPFKRWQLSDIDYAIQQFSYPEEQTPTLTNVHFNCHKERHWELSGRLVLVKVL